MEPKISIQDYQYTLPPDRIANFPLPNRDESKLLVYRKGNILHNTFKSVAEFIPDNATLFFNNTRVIPARLFFTKETGAEIELLLLNPLKPSALVAATMQAKSTSSWMCTIGNLKRWKENTPLIKKSNEINLTATLINRDQGIVDFTWSPAELSFAEVISMVGHAPLPPYIKREANAEDIHRYQTVYAKHEGAVAAPTAGLHFSEHVLRTLEEKGIQKDFLTLHVSAGTFQPIKTENALEHEMHAEQIVVSKTNLMNLLSDNRLIIPVGTTSLRTLESLYWYGVKVLVNPNEEFKIGQNDPYQDHKVLPTTKEALEAIVKSLSDKGLTSITGSTSIYIHPGYTFRVCDGLMTNFHLPGSTLILLIAAFAGEDWRKIYTEALENNYRFLSYGDASLLLP